MVIVPFVGRVHARMVYRSAARALPRCSSSFKTALVHWQAGIVKSIANVVGLVSIPGASSNEKHSTCQFAGALVIGSPPTLLALNCVPVNREKF
jgi:hypothetical protein